ncbi:MAG TPA: MGMT family protein [Nitrososphaerales archaeon]|nr:MGMT family protein [Nitrososphaerales archaeon]
MTVSKFATKVYQLTSEVPRGKVTTYGAIASRMGKPEASRAVGAALRANPTPIVVPCHRVVKQGGELGGYGGPSGTGRKAELLREEGVAVRGGKVDLAEFLFAWRRGSRDPRSRA